MKTTGCFSFAFTTSCNIAFSYSSHSCCIANTVIDNMCFYILNFLFCGFTANVGKFYIIIINIFLIILELIIISRNSCSLTTVSDIGIETFTSFCSFDNIIKNHLIWESYYFLMIITIPTILAWSYPSEIFNSIISIF